MTAFRAASAVTVLGVLAALALTGCSSSGDDASASASDGSLDLVESGKLTICTNPPFAPFELVQDGKVTGLDIDLMSEVATDLGLELAIVETPFDGIESGQDLDVRKCDVAASGLTINDVREEKMDFSTPYLDVELGVLVPDGSNITSVDDLQGKTVAVQQANVAEAWANDQGLDTVQFEDVGLQLAAVSTGQVDAAINDQAVVTDYALNNPDVKVVATIATGGDHYGFAVKKGNTALLDAVNSTLDRVKSDGTYETIYTTWFGTAPSAS